MNLGSINYTDAVPPKGYRCTTCGAHGCKLWREYNTCADYTELLCCDCAGKSQKKDVSTIDADGFIVDGLCRCDQIGWRVPAVPTEEGDTFWGTHLYRKPACSGGVGSRRGSSLARMPGMSSMQDLFNKVKTAAGTIPNNLEETAPGRMQMREDVPGRQTGGLGTPWGEGVLSNEHRPEYSVAVEREFDEGRGKLLGRVFEGMPGMVTADKGLLNELFRNFGDASTTSHSPLLQKKASHAPPPTLSEAVRRLR